MKSLANIYKRICNIEILICTIFLLIVVVLVFIGAITRGLGIPFQEANDIAQLLFAWTSFLGADIALRNEKLVGVDLITRKLSLKTQKFLKILCHILILIILVVFVWGGIVLSLKNWNRSFQTLTLSYSYVTLSLPIGSIFMIFSTISLLNKEIRSLKERKGIKC
ncbi:MAG: TRAP transporter small permease subunit [Fusobacterium mortiferum]|jgi:TRAP-type C4-dicarboxylate transport system permease small subunit|uniref:TRAP transporter small permease n=1 Tax=Fusobacterium sp. FSA-380-WT-2B TaxID=2605786 RepID=UPI0012B2154F|nr:TRAP transporter small permease subunit [Fusobacterium sp. FSA-380-WT-2B]MCI7187728.1 TRAP transporter small permease subunit [Fusobacterium mortiferum]MCI7665900.1 TRAP transporter small permease subunit [Fusobacterium mortiferum]MDY5981600.1 TRAP transporter small permease subunit [Fusobacterium mortiferum]MSS61118.1 TRAP transporter small permease subunit [Fusobacterium sp. FSA-380-WT-2B]